MVNLIQYEVMGQQAQFERYTARLLYVIASGKRIDPQSVSTFDDQIKSLYANPYKQQHEEMTAEQIKKKILRMLGTQGE